MTEILDTSNAEIIRGNVRDHVQNGSALVHISGFNGELPEGIDMATWMGSANCEGINSDLFFPELGADPDAAKSVCQSCTVKDECREFANNNDLTTGIWGGLNAAERQALANM